MTNKIFEHTDYGQLSEITADVCIIGSGCGGPPWPIAWRKLVLMS
jgi:hypothetical protein